MARNAFNAGFIQFISLLLLDKIENNYESPYRFITIDFPNECLELSFYDACSLFNLVNERKEFKQKNVKFILFGATKTLYENDMESRKIYISPFDLDINRSFRALLLCNSWDALAENIVQGEIFTAFRKLHIVKSKLYLQQLIKILG